MHDSNHTSDSSTETILQKSQKNETKPRLRNNLEANINIWIIHDDRPGHLTQLEGLAARLTAHRHVTINWLSPTQINFNIRRLLKPKLDTNSPNIIIGAGHKTHRAVLLSARYYQAFSVILMKPSVPLSWFDAIICPKHDGLAASKRILNTLGALNKVTPPPTKEINGEATIIRNKHLMLLGGLSKHFEWNEDRLITEIRQICDHDLDRHWLLSDSPRTPSSTLTKLKSLKLKNLSLHHFQDESFGSLEGNLKQSKLTWMSPDSMSMLYESLTAGSKVALFTLKSNPKKRHNRIARHVQSLIQDGTVMSFDIWHTSHTNENSALDEDGTLPYLWEADRASRWLLGRFNELRK
jgi:mitochondrial fission protein ELM1